MLLPLGEWRRDGDGVLKTLLACVYFFLRIIMQQKMTAAITRPAPMRDPMTMPAMAPLERPLLALCPPDDAPLVELGTADEVLDGKTGGMEIVVGSLTPWQRVSTLALTQQESVEFAVLPEQKRHSPSTLF